MALYDSLDQKMGPRAGYLIPILMIGLILAAFAFAFYYFAFAWDKAFDTEFPRQINVQGEGKVAIKPDTAVFTAGVVSSSRKIKDAQDENTKKSNAVIDFLKKQGIEERGIKTVGYSINPQYQYYDIAPCYVNPCPPRRLPEVISYEVRHTLEVKVRDLNKVDELLEGVVSAGANEVGSVQFKVDDEEKVRAEARKKAIEDAMKKAEVLEDDLGIRLTKITSFSESGGGIPPYYRGLETFGGKGGGDAAISAPLAPQVQAGEQEVQSFVNIIYEFK